MKNLRVKNLTFSNMQPLVKNPMISKGVVDIAYSRKNRNKSYISDEVMHEKLEPSVLGVPIVGEYFKEIEDFGDHGGKVVIDSNGIRYESTTVPYGFVPPNTNLRYIDKLDKDGVTRKYLRADCYLWTGQYPECERVIRTGNPQSMELDRDTGYWKRIEGEDYYVIEDAIISKLCILGSEVEPCFEGAAFGEEESKVSYSLDKDEYDKFIKEFALQIKDALEYEEGGQQMALDKEQEVIEEEVVFTEEEFQKSEEEIKKEEDEKTNEEPAEEKKDYSLELEEMTETVNTLTMALETANQTIATLTEELDGLNSFKAEIETENKKALFAKFKDKIDDADYDNLYKEIESSSYEELDFQLCKLYTAKALASIEVVTPVPASVKTYELGEASGKSNTWIDAVKSKQLRK